MLRYLWMLLVVSILTGCASHQAPQTQGHWPQDSQALREISNWQLRGQLALFTPKHRYRANLYWEHHPHQEQVELTGPFGQHILSATITPKKTTIISDHKIYHGPNAAYLVYRLTGWQLPLNRLPLWLMGLPAKANYQLNSQQRLAQLTSRDGWQVKYPAYQQINTYVLPQLLNAQHGTTRLKLIINSWTLNDTHHD